MEEVQYPEVQESKGPGGQRKGPMVLGSKRPRYLIVLFKYELDFKEGPFILFSSYLAELSILETELKEVPAKVASFSLFFLKWFKICLNLK